MIEERELLIARLVEGDLTAEEDRRVRELMEREPGFGREAADLVRTGRLVRYLSYLRTDKPDLVVGVTKRLEAEEEHETGGFAEAVNQRLGEAVAASQPMSRRASRRLSVTSRQVTRRASRPLARAARSRWLLAALGAVAIVLLAVGLYFVRSQPPEAAPGRWQAEVSSASGAVDLLRSGQRFRIAAGQELGPGDMLQTGRKARTAIRLGDGTLVELNERTDLALGGSGPTVLPLLGQGDIYVHAAQQSAGHPLVFNAGRHDQAEVLGTEFELSCPEGATTLRVVDGNVRFGPTSAAVTVAAGFASQAQPGGQPGAPEPCDPGQVALWRSGRTPPAVAKVEPKPPPPPPEAEPTLVAKPLTVSVVENVPKAITLAADPGEASATFAIQTGPEHGKLSGDPPQVTYTPEKDYSGPDSFTFTAGRAGGPASMAKVSITVKHVNRPPVSRIAAQPVRGFAPLAVKLDASDSSDADGKVTAWLWKFGDGSADQRVAVDHTYANPGTYVVELTVTDDQQATDTARVTITVERDPDIIAAPTKLDGHRGGKPVAFILSWQDNSDNEEGFHVERAEVPPDFAGGVIEFKFQRLATVGPNVTQARVQLTPTPNRKGTFYFRVCAFNNKTGRISQYAIWAVTWDPKLPDGTLNWPPPAPKDTK